MAEILAFPSVHTTAYHERIPQFFLDEITMVKAMPLASGVAYREIPVPASFAPFGLGISLTVGGQTAQAEPTTHRAPDVFGWLMVGATPGKNPLWSALGYFRQPQVNPLEKSVVTDLYRDVVLDTLAPLSQPQSLTGTASLVSDEFFTQTQAFGTTEGTDSTESLTSCEVRVSWTPAQGYESSHSFSAVAQVRAWETVLLKAAGLPVTYTERGSA